MIYSYSGRWSCAYIWAAACWLWRSGITILISWLVDIRIDCGVRERVTATMIIIRLKIFKCMQRGSISPSFLVKCSTYCIYHHPLRIWTCLLTNSRYLTYYMYMWLKIGKFMINIIYLFYLYLNIQYSSSAASP